MSWEASRPQWVECDLLDTRNRKWTCLRAGRSLYLEDALEGRRRMAGLDTVLETTTAERPATGFVFTEGPLWHPDGFYYFADVRSSVFYRLRLGQTPETVRSGTSEGNGTTFDLQGRLVICEGGNRRV